MSQALTVSALIAAGLSRSFAHHILAGSRICRPPLALWLLDRHGLTVPPLVGRTQDEIDALRAIYGAAPPASIARRLEAMAEAA